jgi:MFS family permease
MRASARRGAHLTVRSGDFQRMSQPSSLPWFRQFTPYHWFVFLVASAAWCFDCMDQRLFTLARANAVESLLQAEARDEMPDGSVLSLEQTEAIKARTQDVAKKVTAVFLIGWGIGGLVFGALGDRYGRAKMLMITVLTYSVFTGLNYFSQTVWDFAVFRFLTGLGVGGVFGLAVALIAETVPGTARAGALGWLQVISAFGNLTAGGIFFALNALSERGMLGVNVDNKWRLVFLVGAVPAFLVIFIKGYLKEPEPWLRAKEAGKLPKGALFGPYIGLVTNRRWRKNLILGTMIASAGVVGCWAIGEYAFDMQNVVFREHFVEQGLSPEQVQIELDKVKTYSFWGNMIGVAIGMWGFTRLASTLGRKPTFYIWFVFALGMTIYTFYSMDTPTDAYWMLPLMGAAQLGLFAGFAIYLPELFPSSMRSTGTSFCYNLGRFAAAAGSFVSAEIATNLYGDYGSPDKERWAAITMSAIFLLGLAALPFAPETKDEPLPE